MINIEEFKQMSNQEKYDLLSPMSVSIDSKQFMDGKKQVGDSTAIKTKYRAMIQNIQISNWEETPEMAIENGRKQLEELKEGKCQA